MQTKVTWSSTWPPRGQKLYVSAKNSRLNRPHCHWWLNYTCMYVILQNFLSTPHCRSVGYILRLKYTRLEQFLAFMRWLDYLSALKFVWNVASHKISFIAIQRDVISFLSIRALLCVFTISHHPSALLNCWTELDIVFPTMRCEQWIRVLQRKFLLR